MAAGTHYGGKPPVYYNGGAGYEMLFAKSFGISAEVGYGYGYGYGHNDYFEGREYTPYFYYGLGLHYYFNCHKPCRNSANQATLPMHSAFREYAVPDEDEETQAVPDALPTSKKRNTNPGDDSDDE
jgi:hypothetical protein